MAIRNGSATDEDYEVEEPTPLAAGKFIGTKAVAGMAITFIILGAAIQVYTLPIEAGTWLSVAGILSLLAGASLVTYNLVQGSGSGVMILQGAGRNAIGKGEQIRVTVPVGARVAFYHKETTQAFIYSKFLEPGETKVELLQQSELEAGGGYTVQVT